MLSRESLAREAAQVRDLAGYRRVVERAFRNLFFCCCEFHAEAGLAAVFKAGDGLIADAWSRRLSVFACSDQLSRLLPSVPQPDMAVPCRGRRDVSGLSSVSRLICDRVH